MATLNVQFTGGASGGASPYTYSLSFGDGSTASYLPIAHSYSTAGVYNAILTVTDSRAQVARDTVRITVTTPPQNPLTCTLNANPTSGTAPLSVQFTGTASGGLGTYTYSLSFGDGGSTASLPGSHTYTSSGIYLAILSVRDGAGHRAYDSARITVSSGGTLEAPTNLSASMYNGQIRLTWADNATGETGYQIQASSNASFSPYDVFTADANATSYYFHQYAPGTTYYFRVRATNGATYSGFSNVASVTTPNTIVSYATAANSVADASNDTTTRKLVYRDGQLFVGCRFTNHYDWTDRFNALSALKFDNLQGLISGRDIETAVLRIYASSPPVANNTRYWVAALAGAWNPNTLTYENTPNWYDGGGSWASPPVSTEQVVEYNITTIVRYWANGTYGNFGLILYDEAAFAPYPDYNWDMITQFESEDDYSHPDRRPHIVVTFR
jgi:PKD repeat protein